jgi:hypothetical protein
MPRHVAAEGLGCDALLCRRAAERQLAAALDQVEHAGPLLHELMAVSQRCAADRQQLVLTTAGMRASAKALGGSAGSLDEDAVRQLQQDTAHLRRQVACELERLAR